jgi:hypothetical protein
MDTDGHGFLDPAAKKHRRLKGKNLLRLLCLFAAMKSVNQNENSGVLCRFHHILKLLIRRVRLFQLGVHVRRRFQEAQQQTALDRVIHILRQRRREMKKDECRITCQRESVAALFLHSSFRLLHLLLAREQTDLRRILDHMIIGNQITAVRDEKARAGGG